MVGRYGLRNRSSFVGEAGGCGLRQFQRGVIYPSIEQIGLVNSLVKQYIGTADLRRIAKVLGNITFRNEGDIFVIKNCPASPNFDYGHIMALVRTRANVNDDAK